MQTQSRVPWILLTAVAPIAWGSVYFVTRHVLPAGVPLWGGVYRALPAGILLLLVARRLPTGAWWWRAVLLGVLNVGGFFALVYVAGSLLPTSIAATLMSASAAAMLLLGWAVLRQRPRLLAVAGALVGIVGVLVMVGVTSSAVDPVGVVASLGAMLSSSIGFVLTVKWGGDIPPVALASWQMLVGAAVLVPFAFVFEGPPPIPDLPAVFGFLYVTVVATALAYFAWFTGLRRLPAAAVGVIGLLNPVTGVVLGVILGGEPFGVAEAVGVVLVLSGVVLGTLPWRRSPAPDPQG